MTNEENIFQRIQDKINKINLEAKKGLKSLNDDQRNQRDFGQLRSKFDCNEHYYRRIARFAWAERAKQIAMIEMQETLNQLKKEYSGKT